MDEVGDGAERVVPWMTSLILMRLNIFPSSAPKVE